MPRTTPKIALLIATALLLAGAAHADAMRSEGVEVPPPAQAESSAPTEVPYTDAFAKPEHEGWRYDDYYIFPLTRHMRDSDLPRYVQYMMYPLAVGFDLGQLPFGAVAGLGGK
jgi:hypothetical protein